MSLTDQGKLWALALGAFYIPVEKLSKMGKSDQYMRRRNWLMRRCYVFALKTAWGVRDRATLQEIIEWLLREGHRLSYMEALKEPNGPFPNLRGGAIGFDACRMLQVVYRGVSVGYLSSEEGWSYLEQLGMIVQPIFSTWKEYGQSYLAGLDFWCKSNNIAGNDVQSAKEALEGWLANPQHPWSYLAWDTVIYKGK